MYNLIMNKYVPFASADSTTDRWVVNIPKEPISQGSSQYKLLSLPYDEIRTQPEV